MRPTSHNFIPDVAVKYKTAIQKALPKQPSDMSDMYVVGSGGTNVRMGTNHKNHN